MNRILFGALAALLLVASGAFWWQGRAETESAAPPPDPETAEVPGGDPNALPTANVAGRRGPAPPEATELTREQRRFARYDRDSDGRVTRNELMSTRTAGFRKLDTDGNNLLTFEEWAVATANKFRAADANGDFALTREEFRTTAPKPVARPKCQC